MRFAAKPTSSAVSMLKFADRLTVLKAVEEDLRVRLLQLRSDVSAYADTYSRGLRAVRTGYAYRPPA